MSISGTAINNSWQIVEEFSQRSKAYHPPLPRKMQRVQLRGRSGKVKIYTEDEKNEYYQKRFNFFTKD